jgi:hypothetical protein
VFRGPNGLWDFGRLAAFHVITAYTFAFLYALVWLQKVPDWSNLGIGYAAVLAGAVGLIAGKDIAVAKANATTAQSTGGTP